MFHKILSGIKKIEEDRLVNTAPGFFALMMAPSETMAVCTSRGYIATQARLSSGQYSLHLLDNAIRTFGFSPILEQAWYTRKRRANHPQPVKTLFIMYVSIYAKYTITACSSCADLKGAISNLNRLLLQRLNRLGFQELPCDRLRESKS